VVELLTDVVDGVVTTLHLVVESMEMLLSQLDHGKGVDCLSDKQVDAVEENQGTTHWKIPHCPP
jgi:hypothetical protein